MARINKRPIIFALSNPTDHAECTAEEAYRWSEGRALYAARGAQFPPVRFPADKTFVPGQGNNLYIFPAVGLAIVATKAGRVTDEMFVVAAHAVADQVTQAELDSGLLYPPQSNILQTEVAVAVKVAETIFARSLAGTEKPRDRHVRQFVEGQLYKPEYPNLDVRKAASARAPSAGARAAFLAFGFVVRCPLLPADRADRGRGILGSTLRLGAVSVTNCWPVGQPFVQPPSGRKGPDHGAGHYQPLAAFHTCGTVPC